MNRFIISMLWVLSGCTSGFVAAQNVSADAAGNVKFEPLTPLSANSGYDWQVHSYWESRYITEGRDNLANKGIVSLSTELSYKDLIIIPWFAKGVNADYSEINLNLIYATAITENLELVTAYNRIQSREQGSNSHDNEVSLELVYSFEQQLQLISNIYYSFAAEGTFLDIAVSKHYQLTNTLLLDLQSHLGFNSGYVADGHNGINHLQLSANLSYELMESMQLSAFGNYSFALNKDASRYGDDALLQDVFWAGIGFSYQY